MRTTLSLFVAALLLAAYAVFIAVAPEPREPKFESQDQQNRHVIERFRADAAILPVVYVGSSMAARLSADVDPHCVYNLALAGDSLLTGLRLLVDSAVTPRVVYVETNVPERAANLRLIRQSEGWLAAHWRVFATENKPVNRMLGYLNQLRRAAPIGVDPRLQAIGLEVQHASYEQTIPAPVLAERLDAIEADLRDLRERRIEVVLFELPTHPSLEEMPRARQIRAAFRARFPDLPYLLPATLAGDMPIQTVDGVHLAKVESPRVAAALANHHAAACVSTGPAAPR